jgi:hypothetical protein
MTPKHACSVALVAASVGLAEAQPTVQEVSRCFRDGLVTAAAEFASDVEERLAGCDADSQTWGKGTVCIADAIEELSAEKDTVSYDGGVRKAAERMQARVLEACAGADRKVRTADDVTLEVLQDLPRRKGALAPPRADTRREAVFSGHELAESRVLDLAREDCLPREPIDVWKRRPGIDRLVYVAHCLGINAALAGARKRLGLVAPAMEKVKFSLTTPAIAYDAGIDRLPPEGVNDTAPIPFSPLCPLPGIGYCGGLRSARLCSLRPGSGRVVDPNQCEEPDQACVEEFVGPDGFTGADVPRGSLESGVSMLTFMDSNPNSRGGTTVEFKCMVDGVRDAAGALVTTDFRGACHDGPKRNQTCGSDLDCDSQVPSRYFCVGGDEYFCRIELIRSSNEDGKPACDQCLIALLSGPPQIGCGTGGKALCTASRCVGGDRDGQVCGAGTIEQLTCPGGGTCKNLREFVELTGDEVGFYNPKLGGMGYMTCPMLARWDLPLDLLDGAGWVGFDADSAPTYFCLPEGSRTQVTGSFIHEPGALGYNTGLPVGLFVRSTAYSMDGVPCPDVSFLLPNSLTGQQFYHGTGPIIGVAGVASAPWRPVPTARGLEDRP